MGIIVRNLSKQFITGDRKNQVLCGVNLEVKLGEIFLLSGKNGSGKTTLLKILSTLILPDSGEIIISGNDVLKQPVKVRKSVGLVSDAEKSFYQMLTVEENMRFYMNLYGISDAVRLKSAEELLERFELAQWKKAKLSHCSSGIKQKLAIVRALLTDPEVILIDELSKSLDPDSRKTISGYLKEIVVSGNKTCIIVTHNPEELGKFPGRSGCLREGVI